MNSHRGDIWKLLKPTKVRPEPDWHATIELEVDMLKHAPQQKRFLCSSSPERESYTNYDAFVARQTSTQTLFETTMLKI